MCVGIEYLTFDILLYAKSKQKVIMYIHNLKKSAKNWVFIKKYTITICVGYVLDCNRYLIFDKKSF